MVARSSIVGGSVMHYSSESTIFVVRMAVLFRGVSMFASCALYVTTIGKWSVVEFVPASVSTSGLMFFYLCDVRQ